VETTATAVAEWIAVVSVDMNAQVTRPVRPGRQWAQVDPPRFAFWQQVSVLGVDPDVGLPDRSSDGAGVREPLGAVARHVGAGFGAAVILTDDRPEPIDDASFYFWWASRRGMHDQPGGQPQPIKTAAEYSQTDCA
jgi:hypothetical protein